MTPGPISVCLTDMSLHLPKNTRVSSFLPAGSLMAGLSSCSMLECSAMSEPLICHRKQKPIAMRMKQYTDLLIDGLEFHTGMWLMVGIAALREHKTVRPGPSIDAVH